MSKGEKFVDIQIIKIRKTFHILTFQRFSWKASENFPVEDFGLFISKPMLTIFYQVECLSIWNSAWRQFDSCLKFCIFTKLLYNVCLINRHARCALKLRNISRFRRISKKYHKNVWHLRLEAHIFNKLLQTVFPINTHILRYQHARCDCKLWNAHWFYCVVWVFSYTTDDYLYLNCCISIKLSLIVCLIILICWYASCSYKLRKVSWFEWSFGNFNVWYKLS